MDKIGLDFDRGDLARAIAEKNGIDTNIVLSVLSEVPTVIASALSEFGHVEWHEFGVFNLERRAPRKGHDFKTGETIDIPARHKVVFHAAPYMRAEIQDITGEITV